jgi:hypothetical protein
MITTRAGAVLAAFGAVALAGLATATPAQAAPGSMVVIDCLGKSVTKPSEIVLACADDNLSVTRITWSSWTANGATGTGTLVWNTCLPKSCADGIVQKYKAKVRLGRVASGPDLTAFSRMTLTFPNDGPAGLQSGWYTLDNQAR